jgi:hypothetical protein
MRFLNHYSEIRMTASTGLYLGSRGGFALYPADSIFVEEYLTTPGQQAQVARKLGEGAEFTIHE